jgi:nicotinamide riboside transporter PnuC
LIIQPKNQAYAWFLNNHRIAMPSPQVSRFQKLQKQGQWRYVLTTVVLVVVFTVIIQLVSGSGLSPKLLALYGFLAAAIAQIDWRISKWRHDKKMNPPKL